MDEEYEDLEAAAGEDEALDADQEGNLGEGADEGADAPADEADPDADPEEEGEAEQPTEKEKEEAKGPKKKSFEERMLEIEAKNEAKIAEAISNLNKQTTERIEADKKPFTELNQSDNDRIDSNIADAVAYKLDLEEAIRGGDRSTQVISELAKTEKWITDTKAWRLENEQKRVEWTAKQGETQKQLAEQQERSARLGTAAEVYREAKNIPHDIWDQSSLWFAEQLKTDKVLGLKFADAYRLKGDVGAVEFAHDYCNEHMGKKAEAALVQKKEAKTKLAPGVTKQGNAPEGPDLKKLLKAAQDSGSEEDFLAYVEAKRGQRK